MNEKKYEIEGEDKDLRSVEDFVKEGFRKFETVVVTDDNGAWYFLIKDKKGKEYWMPLRTD